MEIDPNLIRQHEESTEDAFNNQVDDSNYNGTSAIKDTSPEKKAAEAIRAQIKNLTPEQQRELEQKLKELKLTSRLLPDSSMTTYFGKPAFFAYGNGNTRPTVDNDKLKTFNINPHSGGNHP